MAIRAAIRNRRRATPVDVSFAGCRAPTLATRAFAATRSCPGVPMHDPRITCRVQQASAAQHARGVLAYARVTLDDVLELDGLAIRRTRDGALRVTLPQRTGRNGKRHHVVRVLDAGVRAQIERAVLDAHARGEGGRAA